MPNTRPKESLRLLATGITSNVLSAGSLESGIEIVEHYLTIMAKGTQEHDKKLIDERNEALEAFNRAIEQRDIAEKQRDLAIEDVEELQKENAALRQLVRDYVNLVRKMNRLLYENAGDSEEIDIEENTLAQRVQALLGEEPRP